MKTTKTTQLTIRALALCALLAIPTNAYAFGMPTIDTSACSIRSRPRRPPPPSPSWPSLPSRSTSRTCSCDPHLEASDETTIGEPPIDDGDDDANVQPDPTHDATPGITVVVTSTPAPRYPVLVREPDFPFTGGDATPWMLGGAALMLAGAAAILVKRPKSTGR